MEVPNPGSLGWIPNASNSAWISDTPNGGNSVTGLYIYATTFDLTGFNPATAQINGAIAADDFAVIFLNGTAVGSSPSGGYAFATAVSITSGFRPGINTLTFDVNNTGGVTGLQFNATATAASTAATTPAPSSALVLLLGAVPIVGVLRKRRK